MKELSHYQKRVLDKIYPPLKSTDSLEELKRLCRLHLDVFHNEKDRYLISEFKRFGIGIGRRFCPDSQNLGVPFDIFDDQAMQCGCSNPEYEARNLTDPNSPEVGCFGRVKKDHGCGPDTTKNVVIFQKKKLKSSSTKRLLLQYDLQFQIIKR